MKTYWGMEESGQLHASRSFYARGKSLRYPLDRMLGGPQSLSGCGGEEEKPINAPAGN